MPVHVYYVPHISSHEYFSMFDIDYVATVDLMYLF
jgi:hypothetical protein